MANEADELNRALDQARDAMVRSGMSEATAEAVLFAARPAMVDIRGNLADLQRTNATEVFVPTGTATVTGEGEIIPPLGPEAPAVENEEGPVDNADVPTDDGTSEPDNLEGPVADDGTVTAEEAPAEEAPADQPVDESMTKAELSAEAQRRGVTVEDSMTKAQMIDAINNA